MTIIVDFAAMCDVNNARCSHMCPFDRWRSTRLVLFLIYVLIRDIRARSGTEDPPYDGGIHYRPPSNEAAKRVAKQQISRVTSHMAARTQVLIC